MKQILTWILNLCKRGFYIIETVTGSSLHADATVSKFLGLEMTWCVPESPHINKVILKLIVPEAISPRISIIIKHATPPMVTAA